MPGSQKRLRYVCEFDMAVPGRVVDSMMQSGTGQDRQTKTKPKTILCKHCLHSAAVTNKAQQFSKATETRAHKGIIYWLCNARFPSVLSPLCFSDLLLNPPPAICPAWDACILFYIFLSHTYWTFSHTYMHMYMHIKKIWTPLFSAFHYPLKLLKLPTCEIRNH